MRHALRRIAKWAAVRSGLFDLYHRLKHRDVLTVLMFHRVLPDEFIGPSEADPEYTTALPLFEHFLARLARSYNFVGLQDVLASKRRERRLPLWPLLITFDDGWYDNYLYALPSLEKKKLPWVLFVASEAISSGGEWWQETLLSAVRSGRATYDAVWRLADGGQDSRNVLPSGDATLDLLLRFGALSSEHRAEVLEQFEASRANFGSAPDVINVMELRKMHDRGVSIGMHGAAHLPLTQISDPQSDILAARDLLSAALGNDAVNTLSFPHGRYDTRALHATRSAGIELMFTSDPVLNRCKDGFIDTDLLGRIPISSSLIADKSGALDGERWMPWLFLRSSQKLP